MSQLTPVKKFLQIHTLTSYPAGLLNRDDSGAAKRITFGSAPRIRLSSQSVKKHWRDAARDVGFSEIGDNAIRSKYSFQKHIVEPLLSQGVGIDVASAAGQALLDFVSGSSAEGKASRKKASVVQSDQVLTMGVGEFKLLYNLAVEATKTTSPEEAVTKVKDLLTPERKKELKKRGKELAGVDTALFGRMVLGDTIAAYDAAVHVAHPFSVTAETIENDYFTATDDLATEMDLGGGSSHLGTTELTANVFYGHVVVDLPQLTANLTGISPDLWASTDLTLTKQAVAALVKAIATISVGAKKGSTAPYAYSDLVMVEVGWSQPTSHANAFLKPVPLRGDIVEVASEALARRAVAMDRMFNKAGTSIVRKFLGSEKTAGLDAHGLAILPAGSRMESLDSLLSWANGEIGK